MSASDPVLIAAAFVLSLGVVWAALRLATRRSLYDVPGHRSLHATPTPRIGGIGIVFSSLVVGILGLVSPDHFAGEGSTILAAMAGGSVAAAVGLADDLLGVGLRPRTKFLGQLLAACTTLALLAWFAGGVVTVEDTVHRLVTVAALLVGVLWLTSVANFTNFMDGADGLVAGVAVVILTGYAMVGPPAADSTRGYALIVAAGSLGFLVLNRPPAKIFMGDCGSLFLGLTIGVVGIWVVLPTIGSGEATLIGGIRFDSVLAALVLTAALWVDPVVTLALRSSRGRSLSQAHRDHLYQRMIRRGVSHARVSLVYWAYALSCIAAVSLIGRQPTAGSVFGIALVAIGAAAVLGGHRLHLAVEP